MIGSILRNATLLAAAAIILDSPQPVEAAAAYFSPPQDREDLPARLIGKWGFTVASGNYCDDFEHCQAGTGGSVSFTFEPGGRADYTVFESTFVPGCGQVRTFTRKRGRASVRGATLVFTPISGTYRSVNGCRPDLTGIWQYGPADLKPTTVTWRFEGEALQLTDAAGEASGVFSRR